MDKLVNTFKKMIVMTLLIQSNLAAVFSHLKLWNQKSFFSTPVSSISYVSNTAYLSTGGITTPIGPITPSAASTSKYIAFRYKDNLDLALIPSGTQVIIDITVVHDGSAANTAGTQFVNTAKWGLPSGH